MAVSKRYIFHQLPMIASLGRTAISALTSKGDGPPPEVPGPLLEARIAPRPADLVRDYIREVGGDPRAYRGQLPAHLFSQWGFPLAARTLRDIPYPIARVLNGGCRLEVNGPLPADQPLEVSAQLESIDDDGKRAVLCQRVSTGVAGQPDLVVARLYAIVPLAKKDGSKKKRPAARVPLEADELAYWRIRSDAGMSFALLTGDFNPVHWSRRYARGFGFRSTILHGFGTMARAMEGLIRNRFAGDVGALRVFDVKFTRPLLLPADAGLYLEGTNVYVGTAPGGPAYMTGSFEVTE